MKLHYHPIEIGQNHSVSRTHYLASVLELAGKIEENGLGQTLNAVGLGLAEELEQK